MSKINITGSPVINNSGVKKQHRQHWVDFLHGPTTAWLILAASLLITLVAWKISDDYADRRARERFEFQVNEAESAILKRFVSYEQVLRGGLGLFNATYKVERAAWHSYISTLQIDKFFPGTLGVGYAQWLKKEEIPGHTEQIRAEGFPDYTVHPVGERNQYSSIIFLEPFNKRNQRAFGFDMYSEPTRQKAMARARDTGQSALSGKVTLVQETSTDIQAGFLVYLPHYSHEVKTLEERRQALRGFVYSALRVGDLMQGILGVGLPELDFVIYDGTSIVKDSMLYDSVSRQLVDSPSEDRQFELTREIKIGGHTWTVVFQSNRTFDDLTTTSQPTIVAASGLVIDFLLFNVIMSLARLRKRAQELADERKEKLSEREVQFKSITDSANDGIISTDDVGRITYFNQSAQVIFGYTPEEVIGRSIGILFPEECRPVINNTIEQKDSNINEVTPNQPVEIEGLNKNREMFPLEYSIASWRSSDRKNYTIIVRDITERKRIDRMKSEFISTVSHELRTPLTAIGGSLALLESGVCGPMQEQGMELIQAAHRNADRLANLVNDLLDTEKLASGTMRFDYQDCNVLDLVKHSVDINMPIASQANIMLELVRQDSAKVHVDPDRFHQIMTNLLANAVKFSESGDVIEIAVRSDGDSVRVSVTDHGVGIPDEFRSHIFNKFAQADSSDSRKYGGTGLGLSIVKFIVEKFGGKIDFESAPGQGATFYFDLPVIDVGE